MPPQRLGNTIIIANPTAHSGRGEAAAIFAMRFFSSFHSATAACTVQLTESEEDARRMAAASVEYDTVVALGGDGVVHEVVNGLMSIPADDRPTLGVIPIGSGNDFARTLNISKNDAERSIAELLQGTTRSIDLGRVNDTYFMQTLSFGLDAAIALDTTGRRAENSKQTGAMLYVTSGFKLLLTGLRGWAYKAVIDGETVEGVDVAFAFQNGPTYGGGFRICPGAVPNDGLLDLCYTVEKPTLPHSLALFGLIRFGKHGRSRMLHLRRVQHAEIDFTGDEVPLCQVDGERYFAEHYSIDTIPSALRVIVPQSCTW